MNQRTLISTLKYLHLRLETHTKAPDTLKSRLSYSSDDMQIIGKGDDGLVFKVIQSREKSTPTAIKTIRKLNGSPMEDAIARDQAYREFKALKLIGDHPNFLKLYSEELDDCFVDDPPYDAWAIKISYEPNLWNIMDISRFFGLQTSTVDLVNHSSLVKYINYQMFDVLLHLETLKIRHRDLESVNVKVQMPAMRLIIFDFARADLPDSDGLEHTRCPNDILKEAHDKMMKDRGTETQRASLENYKEVWWAYRIPMMPSSLPVHITKENEYTDFTMMEIQAASQNRMWSKDVRALLNTHNLDEFEQYQRLLAHFHLNIWNTPDGKQHTVQNVLDPSKYQAYLNMAIKCVERICNKDSNDHDRFIKQKKGTYTVIKFDMAITSLQKGKQ